MAISNMLIAIAGSVLLAYAVIISSIILAAGIFGAAYVTHRYRRGRSRRRAAWGEGDGRTIADLPRKERKAIKEEEKEQRKAAKAQAKAEKKAAKLEKKAAKVRGEENQAIPAEEVDFEAVREADAVAIETEVVETKEETPAVEEKAEPVAEGAQNRAESFAARALGKEDEGRTVGE